MNASLKDRKVILIGGAGFIGHNIALRLAREGCSVSVIDSLQVNNLLNFTVASSQPQSRLYFNFIEERLHLMRAAGIDIHIQDARDYHVLSKILDRIKPQVVIHLAAVAHAGSSNKDPYSTFDHSLRTLENALDNCRLGVEHFIYFSSSMVYGHFTEGIVDEKTVCEPLGIYGALKYAGEKIVIAYHQVFKLPYTIIRPSALYGERCVSRRIGQVFIENAIQGLEVQIHGDGSERLDFTYIDDLVEGVVQVIHHKTSKNQIFNITYGEGRSLNELCSVLKEQFPDVKINYLPKDQLMPDRGTLSINKARQLLGYVPQFSLEKGFAKYVAWYRQFFDKNRSSQEYAPVT